MSDSKFKVTDKRMFTPEGELREEYRFLEKEGSREAPKEEAKPEPPKPEPPSTPSGPIVPEAGSGGRRPPPEDPESSGGPGFLDLVMMLAEPATIYLGEARLPDGSTQENLQLARLHIDLLEVVQKKTEGNRTEQESAVLDDVLYQLKTRYVQKRG